MALKLFLLLSSLSCEKSVKSLTTSVVSQKLLLMLASNTLHAYVLPSSICSLAHSTRRLLEESTETFFIIIPPCARPPSSCHLLYLSQPNLCKLCKKERKLWGFTSELSFSPNREIRKLLQLEMIQTVWKESFVQEPFHQIPCFSCKDLLVKAHLNDVIHLCVVLFTFRWGHRQGYNLISAGRKSKY